MEHTSRTKEMRYCAPPPYPIVRAHPHTDCSFKVKATTRTRPQQPVPPSLPFLRAELSRGPQWPEAINRAGSVTHFCRQLQGSASPWWPQEEAAALSDKKISREPRFPHPQSCGNPVGLRRREETAQAARRSTYPGVQCNLYSGSSFGTGSIL